MIAMHNLVFGRKYNPFKLSDFIAYWKLNTNSNDSIGSLNGTNTNITFSTATGSAYSNAATFNTDTPAVVNFGDSDLLSFTDGLGNDKPFSGSIYVNFGTIVPSTFYEIFSKQSSNSLREYDMQLHSSGEVWFRVTNLDSNNNIGKAVIPVGGFLSNTWYHIAFSYNGDKTYSGVRMWLNKLETNENIINGTYTGMLNTTSPLRLGVLNSNALQFKGQQCQFALYNRVLTQTDVDYLYTQMINGQNII